MRSALFLVAAAVSALASPVVERGSNLCRTFRAKNSISSTYHIYFYDNGQYVDPPATLPANLTASRPIKLATAAFPSDKFTITNCTSTTQSSCTHGACYINYLTTGQITHGGKCMTASTATPSATSSATFSLEPCLGSGAATQLFAISQVVNYAPAYASITSYGKVNVDLIQQSLDTSPFQAWHLGSNGRTIQAIEYPYTQAGLSAYLI